MTLELRRLGRARLFGIVREPTPERGRALARAALEAGLTAIEVSAVSAGAMTLVEELAGEFGESVLVGAGTMRCADDVSRAADAGARFCVSASLNPAVVERSAELRLPCFPGVLTPTELADAVDLGAEAVKVFPVSAMGASYLRDLRGPFPDVPLLAVGGVDLPGAVRLLADGALAVGVGSPLFGVPPGVEPGGPEHRARVASLSRGFLEAISDEQ